MGTHRQWVGKAWYFFYFGAGVCLLPYINLICFRANSMTDQQIGVLAALKPWVSAPASFAWSALADARRAHRVIFVSTVVAGAVAHACLSAGRTFWGFVAVYVVSEALGAPVTLLADASVMASAQEDGDYGRTRLYGAWGWGVVGALSGWAVGRFGAPAAFGGYLLLMVPCAVVSFLMECDPLAAKRAAASAAAAEAAAARGAEGPAAERGRAEGHREPAGRQRLGGTGVGEMATAATPTGVELTGRDGQVATYGVWQQQQQEHQQQQQHEEEGRHRQHQQQQRPEPLQRGAPHPLEADAPAAGHADQDSRGHQGPPHSDGHHGHHISSSNGRSDASSGDSSGEHLGSKGIPAGPPPPPHAEPEAEDGGSEEQPLLERPAPRQYDNNNHHDRHHGHDYGGSDSSVGPGPLPEGPAGGGSLRVDATSPGGFWQKLRLMLSSPAVLVFFFQATIMGFGIGVIGEFLFLYLQELGGSEALMGLTLTVTCASEIPSFYLQGAVLRLVSVEALLHFVIFTYALRLGLYCLLPAAGSAWAVLPIELLHGITFGCGWGGGTVQCKRLAQRLGVEGLEATMQGIFQGLYFGVGQGLGALIGGVLMQRHGGRAMFAQTSTITVAAWAACAAAERAACGAPPPGPGGAAAGPPPRAPRGAWRGLLDLLRRRAGGSCTGEEVCVRLGLASQLKSKDSGPDLRSEVIHLGPSASNAV